MLTGPSTDPLWLIKNGQGRDCVAVTSTTSTAPFSNVFLKLFSICYTFYMSQESILNSEQVISPLEQLHAFMRSKATLLGKYDLQVQVGIPETEIFEESALYSANLIPESEGVTLVIEAADEDGVIQKYVAVDGKTDLFQQLGTGTYHQINIPGFVVK